MTNYKITQSAYLDGYQVVPYTLDGGPDPNYIPRSSIKVWDGSAWTSRQMKVWTGSEWAFALVKKWDGNAWVSI